MVIPLTRDNPLYRPLSTQDKLKANLSTALSHNTIASNLQNYQEEPLPQYDYVAKAQDWMNRAAELRLKAARQRQINAVQQASNQAARQLTRNDRQYANVRNNPPVGGGGGTTGGGSLGFQAFAKAIAAQESGGDYSALGVPVNGDRAYGKYQIMGDNIRGPGGWDQQVLGRNITPRRFLRHPKLQDRIAMGMMRPMYRQHGVRGAASEWYSGDPNAWRSTSSQTGGPSINQYVREVSGRYKNIYNRLERRNSQQLRQASGLNDISDPLKGRGNFEFGPEGDFGTRTIGQGWHTGVDFDAPEGTPIYAAHSGKIQKAGYDSGYGNQVYIGAKKGKTTYSHMLSYAPGIRGNVGKFVKKGQLIGYVGNTGSYSQGNHLHFETWRRGEERNPLKFFRRSGVI